MYSVRTRIRCASPPTVTIRAAYAKNRRQDIPALTDELAARLRLHELQRRLLSLGFSVGAFGGESVEDVDHGEYPRAEGDMLVF